MNYIWIIKGISKFTAFAPLGFHVFLHRIYSSGVKIGPVLQKIFISWSGERGKLILQKCFGKINVAATYFRKMFHLRCLTGFWMSLVLNMPGFWTEFWICLNNSWIYLNMPKYAGICRCLNELQWLFFCMFHCNPLPIWMCGYIFQQILKEHEAAFLKSQNVFFVSNLIFFFFFFRLNVFTRFRISFYLLGLRSPGAMNFDIPLQSSWRINIIRKTFVLYALFSFLCWVKVWRGHFRQDFFHFGGQKKWLLVTLGR